MRGPTGATCMKGGTGGVMLGVIIVIGIGGVRVPKGGVIGVIGVITCRVQSTEANCVIILELEHHGFNLRFFLNVLFCFCKVSIDENCQIIYSSIPFDNKLLL